MIKLASPDIQASDIERVIKVLKSGNLVQGEFVASFEKSFSKVTGLPHCRACSSGTAALHLVLLALGIGPGDEVIVPAFTYPATANVVEHLGAKAILCDVAPDTYVVTPEGIEKILLKHKKAKAIVVVHEFGYPVEMKKIAALARKYKTFLIEDAACALGTIADRRHVGYYSDAACFSLHPRKAVTAGEGGVVATKNQKIAEKVESLRNHGIAKKNGALDFVSAGLNYRLTDMGAALAIGQLQRFSKELKKRKKLVEIYQKELAGISSIILPADNPGHSWQSFMIVLKTDINRKKIISKMIREGIQVNLGAQGLHCLKYYREKYHYKNNDFPVSANLYYHGLVLPLYGKLSPKQIRYIGESLRRTINGKH